MSYSGFSFQTRLLLEAVGLLVLATFVTAIVTKDGSESVESLDLIIDTKASGKLTIYDEERAFPGFTLFPVEGTAEVLLLNMKGEPVHKWDFDADRARLLPNCNLLVVHGTKWGIKKDKWDKARYFVREYNWAGDLVWETKSPDVSHHDAHRLANGNTLYLHRTIVPAEAKKVITDEIRRKLNIRADSLREVTSAGDLVWSWHAHEHLDLNYCGKRGCRGVQEDGTPRKLEDWTHMNTAKPLPENKWFKAGHTEFRPGNVLIVARNWWTAMIVDRQSGDIVWEYKGDYKGGLGGGHEAQMIPEGYNGAGNILLFDNGGGAHPGESYILEIDPVTKEVVWSYEAGKDFFSRAAGSVERLANGNTYISEDKRGRAFEVTPEGEIVWEYRSDHETNRSARYPFGYCPKLN